MKIAVLGAGNIGGTLGRKWAQAGHEVLFGVRNPRSAKVRTLLQSIAGQASAVDSGEALLSAEAVLFAVPWSAVATISQTHSAGLARKIVLDASNNFGGPIINNVGKILDEAPTAKVYRAFNSLGWEIFAQPQFGEVQVDLFYCGPDDATRPTVENLIAEIGLRPVWVGDLDQVNLVDNIGALWVTLAFRRGMGRSLAFKLLYR